MAWHGMVSYHEAERGFGKIRRRAVVVGGINVDGRLGPGVPGRTGTRARAAGQLPSPENAMGRKDRGRDSLTYLRWSGRQYNNMSCALRTIQSYRVLSKVLT